MEMSSATAVPLLASGGNAQALAAQLRSHDPHSVDAVANGFEGIFFSILMKEMRQTLEPGSMFGGDKSDILGGMFDMFLGQQLAKNNSLGVGAMIKRQLEKVEPKRETSTVR